MTQMIKNLIKGASTVLELSPPRRKRKKIAYRSQSTYDALKRDWECVGRTLEKIYLKETADCGKTKR